MAPTILVAKVAARALPKLKTAVVANGVRATINRALGSCHGLLRLEKNASLAVLAAGDERSDLLSSEEERILSPRACPMKRTEFALGRAAVGRALRELGEGPFQVLRGSHGDPLWPDGIMGSITHCWPWAVALVTRSERRFAVGLDLESLAKTRLVDISRVICTRRELLWVREGRDCQERLTRVFSAKEAVYKAWYPFCRRYIDFHEVELSWFPKRRLFTVMFLGGVSNALPSVYGGEVHSCSFNGLVFSCLIHEPPREGSAPR